MTNTTISAANRVQQWDDKHHAEYVRANRFKRYMGTSQNSIIQVKEDLTKKRGDAITIPLVGALDASAGANDGSTSLVGNEKALPNDGHKITVSVVRDATAVTVEEEQASPINIRNAGKVALKDLQMQYLRNDLIAAMGSVGGVNYDTATEAQKDAWLDANVDRVLFGNAKGNVDQTAPAGGATNDHSGSLAAVDSSMKLNESTVSLLKRIAQTATNVNGNGIRPFTYGEDEETFVMFVNSLAFRDLKNNMDADHKDAMARGKSNPLFTGTTSLLYDGVVIREIPEIGVLDNVGASNADLSPVYLCGAQALATAWAKRTKTTLRKETDYEFVHGVGFMELRGVEKLQYADKDWGMVTGFVATAYDA
jgi:hypothetical protein